MHRSPFRLGILIVTLGLLASVSAWAQGAPAGELPAQFPCILESGGQELSDAAAATRSGCCDDICQLDDPCPSDCSTIILCGDELCNGSETCSSCPYDCGPCPCGDFVCNGSETCITCPSDCSCFPYPFYSFHRGETTKRIYTGRSYNGLYWIGNDELGNGAESKRGPAAVLFNDQIFVFHRGRSYSEIYVSSSSDGTTWGNSRQLGNGARTSRAPGVAVFQGRIYLAHRGDSNNGVWITSSANGIDWEPSDQFAEGWQTGDAPSLTVYNGELILSFQHRWNEMIKVWGTGDGEDWHFHDELPQRSDYGVGLVEFDGRLWIAYSERGSEDLFVMSGDPTTEEWSDPVRVLSARASERPSLATDGNKLVVLYKGATNENIFYAYSSNGIDWSGNAHAIGKTKDGGPALLSTN